MTQTSSSNFQKHFLRHPCTLMRRCARGPGDLPNGSLASSRPLQSTPLSCGAAGSAAVPGFPVNSAFLAPRPSFHRCVLCGSSVGEVRTWLQAVMLRKPPALTPWCPCRDCGLGCSTDKRKNPGGSLVGNVKSSKCFGQNGLLCTFLRSPTRSNQNGSDPADLFGMFTSVKCKRIMKS